MVIGGVIGVGFDFAVLRSGRRFRGLEGNSRSFSVRLAVLAQGAE
jgi:hypothetical protein